MFRLPLILSSGLVQLKSWHLTTESSGNQFTSHGRIPNGGFYTATQTTKCTPLCTLTHLLKCFRTSILNSERSKTSEMDPCCFPTFRHPLDPPNAVRNPFSWLLPHCFQSSTTTITNRRADDSGGVGELLVSSFKY